MIVLPCSYEITNYKPPCDPPGGRPKAAKTVANPQSVRGQWQPENDSLCEKYDRYLPLTESTPRLAAQTAATNAVLKQPSFNECRTVKGPYDSSYNVDWNFNIENNKSKTCNMDNVDFINMAVKYLKRNTRPRVSEGEGGETKGVGGGKTRKRRRRHKKQKNKRKTKRSSKKRRTRKY